MSYKYFWKRVLDILVSLSLLIFLGPLIIVLLFLVTINIKSMPVYVQVRVGKDEKPFMVYKLKTMKDRYESGILLSDKERVTIFGKILRKTALDELLQLINVLVGHMSIVGPKPLLIRYIPHYTEEERIRHQVKPGMTGLAQVLSKKYLRTDRPMRWEKLFGWDVQYVRNCSFFLDLFIILKTFFSVITFKNISVLPPNVENWLDEERVSKAILCENEDDPSKRY